MKENDLNHHKKTALAVLRGLDCPRSLSISIMIRYGMWDELVSLSVNPLDYGNSEAFFDAYQATKLLSKAKWLPTTIDKRQVATVAFREAELACAHTNQFFSAYQAGRIKMRPSVERIFVSAQRKIGMVLGSDLYAWTEFCNFGPGSDSKTRGGFTSAYNKLSSRGSVTFGAYPYLSAMVELTSLSYLFRGDIETRRLDLEVTRGNRVTFVPKSAKTDRTIAVEPRWNIFLQKGLGKFLRIRLKRYGVDLDDQTVNQRRATLGSKTSAYATIDLASASDTVSRELVWALLPRPWAQVFDDLRSHDYFLDGKWHRSEKFSSMGNGFTFELESLLFWALCSSVDEDVSVYGDDLVIPALAVDRTLEVLGICGFTVNTKKSFSSGPFRESCGEDAFLGVNVTPIYWKEKLDAQGTLSLVNQISRLANRKAYGTFRARAFRSVWKDLYYQLPERFQQRGPTTLSTVVHDSFESWRCCRRYGWDGWFLSLFVPEPIRFKYKSWEPAIIAQNFQPSTDGYVIRGRVAWKKRTVFVPFGHEHYGPWV